ncbi:murein L,D-transpeptidase [Acinetobacter sp. ANC 4558]|uniref:L,D-transpeptidase family protein n=1 Tax=Acinetobacter sp. ANC 4558 TaxID=1977876 RepID=UPI000A33C4B5|nr:L,D-transpeptidase [Acinetobacter sp. ANC 4558]OTG86217.1 murein L,D-transpeptidase [Acinetobacter sp. ANC 4558]
MFVRTLLAISLSCIFAGTAFAAPPAGLPSSSKKIIDSAVEDPINPLEIKTPIKAASEVQITEQEQQDLNKASDTLNNLQTKEDKTSDTGTAPTVQTTAPASKGSWTLSGLNSATWYENIGRGQFPVYARAHVMLNNAHASPGAIDGTSGQNTLKAISSFQQMNGLEPTGVLTQETWNALVAKQGNKPAFIEYTITDADLKGPYAKSIPRDYAEQAKMPGLYYTRVSEMLGEKFHMDEDFLKKLNPNANFNKVGEKIIVTNVRNELPEDIHLIIAHKGAKQLYLFNSKNQMIGSFPATIGSSDTPSPIGTYKVTGVAPNPWYSYSPSNFIQGKNLKPLSLPPGPNGPVGNIWIGLSKKSFGIHGTPNPSAISKTASHGCIRLTNWDANDLGKKVRSGVTVKFLE